MTVEAEPLSRLRQRTSEKWGEYPDDVLPLFVAEMDYPLAAPIAQALHAAVDRSDTGYIGPDDAKEIADRAKARRSGVVTVQAADVEKPVDHLADIAAVLGEDARVRTQEVLHRLATLNEAVYGGWTFADLKAELEPYGAQPRKSDGVMTVSRERVEDAILERLAGMEDDSDDLGGE